MGLKKEKRWLLEALQTGLIVHEFRGLELDKNWLSDGRISKEAAIAMVSAVKGDQAASSPHHLKANCLIWIFTPKVKGTAWYIKFHRTAEGKAKFLSFHPREEAEKS